ncbi:MAG TPA: 50S ribosomal protein L11 methyltransferase [Vicinamibacterales bacterium]|nr:50S ribosomal protein L11 methyltransferase [Vicinamibacterales bacterium]
MSLIVDEHRQYLSDEPRLAAFRAAIEATVRPGDTVLDLAAGTGILGLMACRAGARHVYAIECGGIIGLARDVAAANGCGDRITFVQELSTRADLPEGVDVIVTDQMGRFGFEAGLVEYLADARRRWLAPGGRVIPAGVELWAAPVEHAGQWACVEFWRSRPGGFDFAAAGRLAANTGYPVRLGPGHLLGPAGCLGPLPIAGGERPAFHGAIRSVAARDGVLHGVGGWFSAELAPGVGLSNSPLDPRRIGRRNVFFPIDHPVDVRAGDRIDLTIRIRPIEMVVSWQVVVTEAGPDGRETGRFRGSTFEGMLVPPDELRRTDPASVPVLSPAGDARRSILGLCDGRHTLAEIEAEVYRRHPDLFDSPGRASAFVAEVMTRYAT